MYNLNMRKLDKKPKNLTRPKFGRSEACRFRFEYGITTLSKNILGTSSFVASYLLFSLFNNNHLSRHLIQINENVYIIENVNVINVEYSLLDCSCVSCIIIVYKKVKQVITCGRITLDPEALSLGLTLSANLTKVLILNA